MRHVNMLGAGQCGTLLATMLAKDGFTVDLYERNSDPRGDDAAAGRSINLALSARGFNALEKAGVIQRVLPLLVPMKGRMIHDVDGSTELLRYGQRLDEQIYSVSRGRLNQILLDVAEDVGNISIRFRQQALGYDADRQRVQLHDIDSATDFEIDANPVIAADGAGSVIRNALNESQGIGATEDLLSHGYKELAIPAGPGGAFQLAPEALHIWPRNDFMLIALPNPGGDFTLTLFMQNEGETSFAALDTEQAAADFFATHFADVAPLITDLPGTLVNNPLGLLGTVRCKHWHDRGNVLLIGDAAHAVVPFHGQGMNLAFEDCVVLQRILENTGTDWPSVFSQYETEQLKNANAIADMALENYVEMRDTVLDPKFALQKELSFELERRLPDRFIPQYSMVMFHAEIPYSVAQQRGRIQGDLLNEFTRDAETVAAVNIDAAESAALERLPAL